MGLEESTHIFKSHEELNNIIYSLSPELVTRTAISQYVSKQHLEPLALKNWSETRLRNCTHRSNVVLCSAIEYLPISFKYLPDSDQSVTLHEAIIASLTWNEIIQLLQDITDHIVDRQSPLVCHIPFIAFIEQNSLKNIGSVIRVARSLQTDLLQFDLQGIQPMTDLNKCHIFTMCANFNIKNGF